VIPDEAAEVMDLHWLVFRDEAGWGCDGCDWTSPKIEDFWKTHERRVGDIPF
jgi:hypothetical protein